MKIVKLLLFSVIYLALLLQTGAFVLGGMVPSPLLFVIGLVYAGFGIAIITMTIPYISILSQRLRVTSILSIATLPFFVFLFVLIADIYGFHPFGFLPTDSYATTPLFIGILTLPTSILTLHLIQPYVASARTIQQAKLVAQKSSPPVQHRNFTFPLKPMYVFKVLFVLLFLIPVFIGAMRAIIETFTGR